MKKIFVTGGCGYLCSMLIPKLLENNYEVTVLDLEIFGNNLLKEKNDVNFIKGDIRDLDLLKKNIPGHTELIHLACISNDPSFELNPELGKSINFDSEVYHAVVKIDIDKRYVFPRDTFANIYTSESPGGWNIIGNTPLEVFDKTKEEAPNLINPGDTVIFKEIIPATAESAAPTANAIPFDG